MRVLLQRVSEASVSVSDRTIGKIGPGFLIFLGIAEDDNEEDIRYLTEKLVHLRVFANGKDKFDRSLLDVKGEALVVSQFTLYGSCAKGRRPDFIEAAKPEVALPLYKKFVQELKEKGICVAEGEFGAYMKVSLVNDGPVTLWLDSTRRSRDS